MVKLINSQLATWLNHVRDEDIHDVPNSSSCLNVMFLSLSNKKLKTLWEAFYAWPPSWGHQINCLDWMLKDRYCPWANVLQTLPCRSWDVCLIELYFYVLYIALGR